MKRSADEAMRDIVERCEHSQDLEAMRLQIMEICKAYWKRSASESSGGGGGFSSDNLPPAEKEYNDSSSATAEERGGEGKAEDGRAP